MRPIVTAHPATSERSAPLAARPGVRVQSMLASVVGWFGPLLLVYVSVEPALLGIVPTDWYWPLRLLPDAVIALLVAVSILTAGRRQPWPNIVAVAVLSVVVLLTAADVARGNTLSTTVNAYRVIVRYLLLAALFLNVARTTPRVIDRVVAAVAVACGVQLVAAAWQALNWIAAGGSIFAVPALDGLTGRYDRLGLLLTVGILVLLGYRTDRPLARWIAVIVALIALLLTTSRQAEIALAVGGAMLALLPGQASRSRAAAGLVGATAIALILVTPGRITVASVEEGPPPPGPGSVELGQATPPPIDRPSQTKGGTQLSIDPNANFRLYLILSLAPWAAAEEPVLGFGPGQQIAEQPDPRLAAKLAGDGTTWRWARSFMNDSTLASWIIQFGIVAPLLLLAVVAAIVARLAMVAVHLRDRPSMFPRVGVAIALAILAAAMFGPVLETRLSSITFWLVIAASFAATVAPTRLPAADDRGPEGEATLG
jgi:hypothetical protein